ncbi:related to DCN1-scaffold-type E3 ligase [Ustilago bromivora]|uniref:Defective in cullin neddylation protein n=1 Tax=Ustilago bromivora TaxID=307758 RepID=A0A1K0FZW9_9BASI|nr:related to DCN1-scaffold-type E3 ligase [Ustilago bromivora]SYW83258.1 related to DCN1 - scaffold-type E3 ligase [Ustilago bromivora]
MSSSAKKEAVLRRFRELTSATPQDAHRILKAHGYRIESATNAFFNDKQAQINASASSSTLDKKTEREVKERLNALFDRFRDSGNAADSDDENEESRPAAPEDSDTMSIAGALKMCEALEVSPEDVVFLPLSYYLKSPSIGTFTRNDYINGWKMLDLSDTINKQQKTLEKLRQELLENKPPRFEHIAEEKSNPATASSANKGLYEKVYEYTYGFARKEGQKSLALENALAFWDLILPASPTFQREGGLGTFTQQHLDQWKKFLSEQTGGRAVSKDTWVQFLDFTKEINQDFSNHDFDAAWPSVIDDFVMWAKENLPSDGMDTS